ncbi:E3.1.11.2 [Mytilus coruscus]|uniref:E3.1.11.2 n=1 Tax=Mytilus coruscus TaxID=42192 RepID=A0A6J8EVQ0_MYTCO|nr:E3.1.11.2 [Mytilus coruscus]
MVNFPEKRNENLRDVFVKIVKKDFNVEIEPLDVIGIHRIPGKEETHSNEDIEKLWQDEWGNTCIFSHCNNKRAGVSVMFEKGLDLKNHDSKVHHKGRFIVLDLSLYEQRLTFVTVYGFNKDEPSLFTDILHDTTCYTNTSLLMCGDWNVVQDFQMDTYNILHNRNLNSRNKIKEISQTFELLDPWRTCHPDDKKFTWRQTSPIKQSRLDYFLLSEDLFSLMKNTKIIPGYKTNHSAIVFAFSASLDKRGKGYWKFNIQLLRDTAYVEKVKMCIKDTVFQFYLLDNIDDPLHVQFTCNDHFFLQVLTMKIRSLSITHSISKSKEEKNTTLKL